MKLGPSTWKLAAIGFSAALVASAPFVRPMTVAGPHELDLIALAGSFTFGALLTLSLVFAICHERWQVWVCLKRGSVAMAAGGFGNLLAVGSLTISRLNPSKPLSEVLAYFVPASLSLTALIAAVILGAGISRYRRQTAKWSMLVGFFSSPGITSVAALVAVLSLIPALSSHTTDSFVFARLWMVDNLLIGVFTGVIAAIAERTDGSAVLTPVHPQGSRNGLPLDRELNRVGSSANDEVSVSGLGAAWFSVERQGDRYFLRNTSGFAVYVNGFAQTFAELFDNDMIDCGLVRLIFQRRQRRRDQLISILGWVPFLF